MKRRVTRVLWAAGMCRGLRHSESFQFYDRIGDPRLMPAFSFDENEPAYDGA